MRQDPSVYITMRERPPLYQIAIAVLTVALALAVKFFLIPATPDSPFLMFFMAVLVSAWFGGLLSGLLASLLAALLANYVFIEPVYSFAISFNQLIQLLLFCLEGGLISVFIHWLGDAYRRSAWEVNRHEQIEQTLRESEERFRLLVEGVKDYAIFTLDPNGIITSWNAGAERAKGYTAEEIIGKPLSTLYTPEDAEAGIPEKLMQKAISEGSAEIEGWRVRKDGSRFWANIIMTSLWERGQLRGFSKVTRDMTLRKQAEELSQSLERERIAREEAERANQLKMRFLAMISHELRTPLTSIKGFTSTLLADDVEWTSEQYQQFLTVIDQESDKLHELIEQLLDLSQIQAGVLKIRAQPQPFITSLEVAREQLNTITANRQFNVNIAENLPHVTIDERRIAQVITNIVGNAAKYTPPKTPITLTAFSTDEAVQVEISDEGAGIPEKRRETIFEPFNLPDKKVSGNGSVGLGLAICKGIVDAHGGKIWVKDTPTPGTTIAFTLPLADTSASA